MADTYKSCCERADAAADAAKNATLENVRERELRAERTWRKLADQARSVVLQRENIEREKAEQRAAEFEMLNDDNVDPETSTLS